MTLRLLGLMLKPKDVGGTIAVEVRLGDALVGRYLPGTGHDDRAVEIVSDALAAGFRAFLDAHPDLQPCSSEEWE